MMNFSSTSMRMRPGRSPTRAPGVPRAQPLSWTAKCLLLCFILTIFEGAVRKWVVSGVPVLRYTMYFSKDLVFFLAALPAFGRFTRWRNLAVGTLLPLSLAFLLLPTLANVTNSNIVGFLLSVRAYLVLPLCAFVAAGMVGTTRLADRVAWIIGISVFFIAYLGWKQYNLPTTHWLNKYESTDPAHIVQEFGHVRATGTFAFITGMGVFAGVASWAGIYLFLTGTNLYRRLFSVGVMGSALVCAMVSMSRGGAYYSALTIVGGVMLFRRIREVVFLGAIAAIAYTLFTTEGGAEGGAESELQKGLTSRLEKRESIVDRGTYALTNLQMGLFGHPLGEGMGVGQVGGNWATTGKATWGGGYETELGRIAYEVGIMGFIGVLMWRFAGVRELWKQLKIAQDIRARALLAATFPLFGILSLNSMAFNHTSNSFAWAILALTLGTAMAAARSAPGPSPPPRPSRASPALGR
jgi:hypothetical protein